MFGSVATTDHVNRDEENLGDVGINPGVQLEIGLNRILSKAKPYYTNTGLFLLNKN